MRKLFEYPYTIGFVLAVVAMVSKSPRLNAFALGYLIVLVCSSMVKLIVKEAK